MRRRILFIEDDPHLQESVPALLRSEGLEVLLAGTLAEARSHGRGFDLFLADWMLPDGQGVDFLKELRYAGIRTPVILLTARAEVLDKVLGLETGANDYITKPFEPRELIARIRVQLRETQKGGGETKIADTGGDHIQVGSIELRLASREAFSNGKTVELTKMEFDLLRFLCESPGRVFSRDELLNRVWGLEKFPTTRTVDTHILQLRQKFGESLFETVRGIGYRLKN